MNVNAIGRVGPLPAATPAPPVPGSEFGDLLAKFTRDVDGLQHDADKVVADLAAGKTDNLHQVMIALGKAEISFKFMTEVRNKLLDAYKEVMRTPV